MILQKITIPQISAVRVILALEEVAFSSRIESFFRLHSNVNFLSSCLCLGVFVHFKSPRVLWSLLARSSRQLQVGKSFFLLTQKLKVNPLRTTEGAALALSGSNF